MSGPAIAVAVLAAALMVAGHPTGPVRLRVLAAGPSDAGPPHAVRAAWIAIGSAALAALVWAAVGGVTGVVLGGGIGVGCGLAVRTLAERADGDATSDAELACAWELLAVCLQVGLPVAAAVAAAAERLAGTAGAQLRRVAGLLELGADPAEAWRGAEELAALAAFARAARRSAGTGAALAQVALAEGERIRAGLVDAAQARAERAGVLITGPLGLCFLPAFLVLGIAPVVIGLAGEALARW